MNRDRVGTDVTDLRLLRHRDGAVALAVGLLALAAAGAVFLPWYEVVSEVTLLNRTEEVVVAQLDGWEAHPWATLIGVVLVGAAALCLLVAVDRPPARARVLVAGAGAVTGIATVAAGLVVPAVERFALAGPDVAALQDLATRLPAGVRVDLVARPTGGAWLLLATGLGLLLVAAVHPSLRR